MWYDRWYDIMTLKTTYVIVRLRVATTNVPITDEKSVLEDLLVQSIPTSCEDFSDVGVTYLLREKELCLVDDAIERRAF